MSNSITSGAFRLLANSSRPGLFPDVQGGDSSPIALQIKYQDTFQPETSGPRQELLEADRLMRALRDGKGQTTSTKLVESKNASYFMESCLDGRFYEAQQVLVRLPGSADPITNAIFFVVGQEIFVKQG